jgi:hypothetical protein
MIYKTVTYEEPKHPIGTTFEWVRSRKVKHQATVVGYHIEHNTDTERTEVQYRISYDIGVQMMVATVARSTVDMGVMKDLKK